MQEIIGKIVKSASQTDDLLVMHFTFDEALQMDQAFDHDFTPYR